jgi:hypothetical protein
MRLPSPSLLKAAGIYTLLAIAYTLPTSIDSENVESSLSLRAPPRWFGGSRDKTPADEQLPPPRPVPHPQQRPGGSESGPPRLGTTPANNPPNNPPNNAANNPANNPANSPPKLSNVAALDAKMREDPIISKDFTEHDAKIGKYTVKEERVDGVVKVNVYGKPNLNDREFLMPAWYGTIDAPNGIMIRNSEFRKGGDGAFKAAHYYPGIPTESDRLHISEHIAKSWKDHGNGQPMKENYVYGIANKEMEGFLDDKPNPVTYHPDDPEWATVMESSAGGPLANALTDHPDVFHKYVPIEVTFKKKGMEKEGMWDADFKLDAFAG